MKLKNLSLMLALALGCTACAVGPDFKRPEMQVGQTVVRKKDLGDLADLQDVKFDAVMQVQKQWWKTFHSPLLDKLIAQAFEHNPNITSAQAALRQAQENLAAQQATYWPTTQLNYSASRQKNAAGTVSPTLTSGVPLYTLHTSQLNISYVPDVFGLNRRTVESLAAQEEVQQHQLRAAYVSLAANVANTAIQLASVQAQVGAAQEMIGNARRMLDILKQQSDAGFASGGDVAAQETALAQTLQMLPPLQKQLEQTRDLLAVLIGRLPAELEDTSLEFATLQLPERLPSVLPSSLLDQRPDILAAQAQLHAASAQVGIAIANRLPQISIAGNYGGTSTEIQHMFSDGNKFWGLTGNVAQTVFDFGALKHKQGAAQAAFEQAEAQYRAVVLTAFQNVADTLYAFDADSKSLDAARLSEKAAQKSLDLTNQQLALGAVGALPALNAAQSWQQARLSRIQAQAARYGDVVALYQALGAGW